MIGSGSVFVWTLTVWVGTTTTATSAFSLLPSRYRSRTSLSFSFIPDGQAQELVDEDYYAVTQDGDDNEDDDAVTSSLLRQPNNNHNNIKFNHDDWLDQGTRDFLDPDLYPVGKLTQDDVDTVSSLMSAWARRRSVDAALTVERLLKRIVDDMRAQDPVVVHLSTRFYTHAIDAWAKSGGSGGSAQRAQNIHDAMIQMYNETKDPLMAPSVVSYNALINAWSKSSDRNAAQMADRALMQMIHAYRSGNASLKPDSVSFCTTMHALSFIAGDGPFAVQRSQELFDLMDELEVRKHSYTYSALQNVVARSGLPDAPERARRLLDEVLELHAQHADDSDSNILKPTVLNYNDVLNAYSRTPSKKSAQEAMAMLEMMERSVQDGGYDVDPDRLSYALAALACARCPDEVFAADSAESVLEKLEGRALLEAKRREAVSSAAPPSVVLDIECFNVVLTALARVRLPDSGERALRIIERMNRYADDGMESVRPTIRSWNAVLNAFARATGGEMDLAREAERILERISQQFQKGESSVKPNAFTFAAVLNCYQRSQRDPLSAQRADAIVRRMEELYESNTLEVPPDVVHYTIVCSAWAKSGAKFAAERCLQIIAHMHERDRAGYANVKPNIRTYNAVLDCLCRSKQEDQAEQLLYQLLNLHKNGDESAKPDRYSFNCLIRSFCRSRERGSGRRAEAILDRFLEFQEENPVVKPDVKSFNHIITYWYSKSSQELDAPYRAEYILNRMLSLYTSGRSFPAPNLYSFAKVIDSYSRANHVDAGKNAERLLKSLRGISERRDNDLAVTTAVINSVMFAWASSGDENAGQRAELHLDEMESRYRNGSEELKPDTRSYGYVISAWSKSNSPEKARRALLVLRRMEAQRNSGNDLVVVDDHAYSLVINACAFCNAGVDAERDAFDIAVSLFNEMVASSDLDPSSLTFGWFIQACGRLRVDASRREPELENAFNKCCEAGLVSDFVLQRFKGATTDALFERLVFPGREYQHLKKHRVSVDQLPSAWRRNCMAKKGGKEQAGSDR